MTYYIGDKVVCVNELWTCHLTGGGMSADVRSVDVGIIVPAYRQVYTVRGIVLPEMVLRRRACLLLEEIRNEERRFADGLMEPCFSIVKKNGSPNFLPVAKREYSIATFEAMLDKSREPAW